MFSTLLGPLPPLTTDPATERGSSDALELETHAAAGPEDGAAALAEIGLDLVSDGEPALGPSAGGELRSPSVADPDPAAIARRWRATADATGLPTKQSLVGPIAAAAASGRSAAAEADRLRAVVIALADAGCAFVEIVEPGADAFADGRRPPSEFAAAHRRLIDGADGPDSASFAAAGTDQGGVHLSLALGGSVDGIPPTALYDLGYASFAFDLIGGPDNWRVIADAPPDRGIVCGAIGLHAGADATREVLVWAAHYAASIGGRGLARVGLANAPAAGPVSRAEMLRRLAIVVEATRIASVESAEELAGMLDPRAIDPRSAATGRFDPARRRRP